MFNFGFWILDFGFRKRFSRKGRKGRKAPTRVGAQTRNAKAISDVRM